MSRKHTGKKSLRQQSPFGKHGGGGVALIGARSRRKCHRAAFATVQSKRALDPPPLVERPCQVIPTRPKAVKAVTQHCKRTGAVPQPGVCEVSWQTRGTQSETNSTATESTCVYLGLVARVVGAILVLSRVDKGGHRKSTV